MVYNLRIKEMAREERPRERLQSEGVASLSNEELLAIILRTGSKEKSALDLAKEILSKDQNGIRYLFNCSLEELCQIKGIGIGKASQILSTIEIGKRIARSKLIKSGCISSPKEIADFVMQDLKALTQEHFKTVFLNTKNEIIAYETISIGTLNASIVHPRDVFNQAIRKSSANIILVHNHPSGNPNPSAEDIKITKRLAEAGDIIGIKVLDHIVVGDSGYYSMKENELF